MGELNSQLGRRVYLDTNIIIYAVEGYEAHAAHIKFVLQGMTRGNGNSRHERSDPGGSPREA